jgi:hypothetical protein
MAEFTTFEPMQSAACGTRSDIMNSQAMPPRPDDNGDPAEPSLPTEERRASLLEPNGKATT